jgi:putative ABC transport system permease protein
LDTVAAAGDNVERPQREDGRQQRDRRHARLAEFIRQPAWSPPRVRAADLLAVLALIGLTRLLTASLLGQRDHARDVSVLRAMGLTPLQIRTALMMRTTVLALVAVVLGAGLGRLASDSLVNSASRLYGLGAGIGKPPSAAALAAAVVVVIGSAALAGIVPVRPGSRVPAVRVLGP